MRNEYEVRGNLTTIFLNHKGGRLETVISTSDLPRMERLKLTWFAQYNKSVNSFYVVTNEVTAGKRVRIQLHRYLTACPEGLEVDHINHDTMNNTQENLRIVTHSENQRNRRDNKLTVFAKNKSGIKGVSWAERQKSWLLRPKINGEMIYLGYYKDIEQAKKALINYYEENSLQYTVNHS